jgi:hypothetical protein
MRNHLRVAVAAAGALAAAGLTAGITYPSDVAGAATLGTSDGASPFHPFTNYTGAYAGYASGTSTLVNRVEGGTDVPALTCTATDAAMFQSFQVYSTAGAGAAMFIDDLCVNGAPSYQLVTATWTSSSDTGTYETPPIALAPGDIVGALLTVSSHGALQVTVKNVTTKSQTFTQTATTSGGQNYYGLAYIQNDMPSEPIPTFGQGTGPGSGPIAWYNVTVDKKPISMAEPAGYTMTDPANNDVMIDTSSLSSSSTGETFYNTFVANS